jgi:hypothetical protein
MNNNLENLNNLKLFISKLNTFYEKLLREKTLNIKLLYNILYFKKFIECLNKKSGVNSNIIYNFLELNKNNTNFNKDTYLVKKINSFTDKVNNFNKPIKSNLSISIGDFIFELIMYYPNANKGRSAVKIFSKNIDSKEITEFYVYKSLSECGFWRFCSIIMFGTLYKGSDYVQETFINLKLQEFINENLNKLPKNEEITMICPRFNKNGSNFENIIGNKSSRKKIIEPFYQLVSGYEHNFFLEKSACGHFGPKSKKLLEEISKLIATKFPIISNPIIIYKNFFQEIPLDSSGSTIYRVAKINGNIYKVILSERPLNDKNRDNEKVILYYLYYTLETIVYIENTNKSGRNHNIFKNHKFENQYAPVILLTDDSDYSVNKYGLYNNFVVAGSYICKILEYAGGQSHFYKDSIEISETYNYIGKIYQNLYPYNILSTESAKNQ